MTMTDPETTCIECHSPHEPLFLLESVKQARIHPVIYECTDCHAEPPEDDVFLAPGVTLANDLPSASARRTSLTRPFWLAARRRTSTSASCAFRSSSVTRSLDMR